jgi:hypothetical protein
VRFITTHGFWHSNALESAWIKGFIAITIFGGVLVFKFGNDSVTAAAIRASISGRTARAFSPFRFHPVRSPCIPIAFWLSCANLARRKHTNSARLRGSVRSFTAEGSLRGRGGAHSRELQIETRGARRTRGREVLILAAVSQATRFCFIAGV